MSPCTELSVVGQHLQVVLFHRSVLASVFHVHMQAFAPCGIIVYAESEFHTANVGISRQTSKFWSSEYEEMPAFPLLSRDKIRPQVK